MVKPIDKKLEKLSNKEKYRLIRDGAVIDIGGDDDTTFIPEAHTSKWNGECWLKISHKDKNKIKKNKKATEKIKDGKLELECDIDGTGRKHKIREGSLKWEIEYASEVDLPIDDVEIFDLEFPYDQLIFYHQSELTHQEIGEGANRPENVINSYAGYFNKSNNAYETGKFCHIYRSKMTAVDGAETWVNQGIVDNQLKITIPRQWCADHGYPVTLDPDIGYTTAGASEWGAAPIYGVKYTTASDESGTLDSMSVAWINNAGANRKISLGLYEGTTPGAAPDAGEIQSDFKSSGYDTKVDEAADFMEIDFSGESFSIQASTDYWLAKMFYHSTGSPGQADADVYYDTTDPRDWMFGTATDPWEGIPSNSGLSYRASIYFTYTEVGGSTVTITGSIPAMAGSLTKKVSYHRSLEGSI